MISKDEYNRLPDKAQSGVPTLFYYDQQSPLGVLYIWPVPAAGDLPLSVVCDALQLFTVALLTDVPDLPDHWVEAIINNLAVILSTTYGRPVAPELSRMAMESLALAKKMEFEQADIQMSVQCQ
jgi:hypothetical protein